MKKCALFQNWKGLVKDSFAAFPKVCWRIVVVNLLTLALIAVVAIPLIIGMISLVFGGLTEFNVFLAMIEAKEKVDTQQTVWFFLTVFGVILIMIFFGTLGKIANWTIIKNFKNKKNKNPFKSYFVDSWQFFGRYLLLALKIGFYVVWPIALVAVIIELLAGRLEVVTIILSFLLAIFTIFRIFRIIFAPAFLIAADKKPTESIKASMAMVKGNWWRVFLSLVSFGFMISIPLFFSNLGDYYMSFGWDFSEMNLKDYFSDNPQLYSPSFFVMIGALFSLFIVAPLVTGFMYFFMLNTASNKKIKI